MAVEGGDIRSVTMAVVSLSSFQAFLSTRVRSGYWITNKAIRYVYDEEDGLYRAPADISFVKKAIFDYFSIQSNTQLLDFLYAKFNKAHVAGLCKVLADGKKCFHFVPFKIDLFSGASHDKLSQHVFKEAGHVLGLHVLAVAKHADAVSCPFHLSSYAISILVYAAKHSYSCCWFRVQELGAD